MPYIYGLKSKRSQRKKRQKKHKTKSSLKSLKISSSKLSNSPKTKVKKSMAATKIQRTMREKKIQKIDRLIKSSLKNELNLSNTESQIYMHLYKKLDNNRDAADIILEYIRNRRIIKEDENRKKIAMIEDLLEIFDTLSLEFDEESTRECIQYSLVLNNILDKIESQQIPIYSDQMSELLNSIIELEIRPMIIYLEDKWMEYFDVQMEQRGLIGITNTASLIDEFLMNVYKTNGANKYY